MRKRIAYNHLKQARRIMERVERLDAMRVQAEAAGLVSECERLNAEIAEKTSEADTRVRMVTIASNDHPELCELICEMVDF